MAISVSGDTSKLAGLIDRLGRIADGRILKIINQNLAEEAIELVKQGFEDEKDPFGSPWAPLKRRTGRILQDTARLKNSFNRPSATSSDAGGFRIGTNVQYAVHHQFGAPKAKLPKRMMLPTGELPEAWVDKFQKTADEILTDLFKI
jgi:phage gpG-like protein